jgi:hypothetical protein
LNGSGYGSGREEPDPALGQLSILLMKNSCVNDVKILYYVYYTINALFMNSSFSVIGIYFF